MRHVREVRGNHLPSYAWKFCQYTSKWKGDVKRHEGRKHKNEYVDDSEKNENKAYHLNKMKKKSSKKKNKQEEKL